MRLLNARTIRLEEIAPNKPVRYAILSHRWGDDEITFQDITRPLTTDLEKCEGYRKLRLCCEQALRDGLEYAWVDTCCIDKSSSAELSEAINSMFKWYRQAVVCYAYLADVEAGDADTGFDSCDWFSRGWTLQELLAPRQLEFYSREWHHLGSKHDLARRLRDITKIGNEYLYGEALSSASIAERMSWASQRETTREEDMAYCLLGIFDINMPLLYGEGGTKAFLRLQQELIKANNDQSIFAWSNSGWSSLGDDAPAWLSSIFCFWEGAVISRRCISEADDHHQLRGVLAESPQEFKDSGKIAPDESKCQVSFTVSNRGVELKQRVGYGYISLSCTLKDTDRSMILIPMSVLNGIFYRHDNLSPAIIPRGLGHLVRTMWARHDITMALGAPNIPPGRRYPWLLGRPPPGMKVVQVYPDHSWSGTSQMICNVPPQNQEVDDDDDSNRDIIRGVRVVPDAGDQDLHLLLVLRLSPPGKLRGFTQYDYGLTQVPPSFSMDGTDQLRKLWPTLRKKTVFGGQNVGLVANTMLMGTRHVVTVEFVSGPFTRWWLMLRDVIEYLFHFGIHLQALSGGSNGVIAAGLAENVAHRIDFAHQILFTTFMAIAAVDIFPGQLVRRITISHSAHHLNALLGTAYDAQPHAFVARLLWNLVAFWFGVRLVRYAATRPVPAGQLRRPMTPWLPGSFLSKFLLALILAVAYSVLAFCFLGLLLVFLAGLRNSAVVIAVIMNLFMLFLVSF